MSIVANVVKLVRPLTEHPIFVLRYDGRNAARRAGSSATVENCTTSSPSNTVLVHFTDAV